MNVVLLIHCYGASEFGLVEQASFLSDFEKGNSKRKRMEKEDIKSEK